MSQNSVVCLLCFECFSREQRARKKKVCVSVCVISVRGTPLLPSVISQQRKKGNRGQAWKRGGGRRGSRYGVNKKHYELWCVHAHPNESPSN